MLGKLKLNCSRAYNKYPLANGDSISHPFHPLFLFRHRWIWIWYQASVIWTLESWNLSQDRICSAQKFPLTSWSCLSILMSLPLAPHLGDIVGVRSPCANKPNLWLRCFFPCNCKCSSSLPASRSLEWVSATEHHPCFTQGQQKNPFQSRGNLDNPRTPMQIWNGSFFAQHRCRSCCNVAASAAPATQKYSARSCYIHTLVLVRYPQQNYLCPTFLSNTLLQHSCSTLVCNSSLQHASPTLLYNALLQHSSTTLLQQCSPTLLYNTFLQHFCTVRFSNTPLQHSSTLYTLLQHLSATTLLYNNVLQHFTKTLFSNASRQHFSTTLFSNTSLQNFSNTSLQQLIHQHFSIAQFCTASLEHSRPQHFSTTLFPTLL